MQKHLDNALLANLSKLTFAAIEPNLRSIDFERGRVLAEAQTLVERVYFPQSGVISTSVRLADGHDIQTGMVGWDGEFGAGPALDSRICLSNVTMLATGRVSVVDPTIFKNLVLDHHDLREVVLRSEQFFLGQVQQAVACGSVHSAKERFCKLLLRMMGLVGNSLNLTQDEIADLLGLRRTSVSAVAAALQKEGAIAYRRGRIEIVSKDALLRHACECHQAINEHHQLLFAQAMSHRPSLKALQLARPTITLRAKNPGTGVDV